MATKRYQPRTPGFRHKQVSGFEELSQGNEPVKALLVKSKRGSGRNNVGKLTVRHRGGGAKRRYRIVDFKRNKEGVPGVVKSIEYDPNRSANIALIAYNDGDKAYIVSPQGVEVGSVLEAGEKAEIRQGNTLPLKNIPVGSAIHNVELSKNRGAQLARSAGVGAVLMAKNDKYGTVKLPSGEVRLVNIECRATLGTVGNAEKRNAVLGKAGTSRHMGRRPVVRGSVMNACDHPHGGGEGRAPIGHAGPLTKWGKPALGYKTRKKRKKSTFIVKRRK